MTLSHAETTRLASEVKSLVTPERMKEMTIRIIGAFRRREEGELSALAEKIIRNSRNEGGGRSFALLIKTYHPDRIAAVMKEIDRFEAAGDREGLLRLRDIYSYEVSALKIIEPPPARVDEVYEYDEDDFAYAETDIAEEESGLNAGEADIGEEPRLFEAEYTFMEALHSYLVGNLDYTLTVGDLENLDGELDLSDCAIADLSGAEHCFNVTELNLSGNAILRIDRLARLSLLRVLYLSENEIESVTALAALRELEELDLSFNAIENISPLLALEKLMYLNIVGNPVRDRSVIGKLEERGVIVVI